MSKTLKRVGAGLLVVLTAALVPCADRLQPSFTALTPEPLQVPPEVSTAIESAAANGEAYVDMDLLVTTPGEVDRVQEAVRKAGGEVLHEEQTYLRVKLPVAAAESLPKGTSVQAVAVNETLPVGQPGSPAEKQILPEGARALADISMQAIGAESFRQAHGVTGRGVTVAVIDSGVDPGHPGLRSTPEGAPKIIDWKDFTGEGQVKTLHPVPWGTETFVAPNGAAFKLPLGRERSVGMVAQFGLWEESRVPGSINRDLNRNGSQIDQFGVLVLDSVTAGTYDLVYVDTNTNRDFNDETPLRVYRTDTEAVGALGTIRVGPLAEQRLNFVVADIHPNGRSVTFGFDGMGHGTEVAGVLGANDPRGFSGVAPGVQIMALKAVSSDGNAPWFAISDAVQYAARNGASVINISLSGLAAGVRNDRLAPELLNRLARQYGVLIVLAAGNSGPGLSSGATVGNPSEVLSVGAYYSAAMWKRDFGSVVPNEGVYWWSGMGPRSDGSYVPSVIAPGGSPTTTPAWSYSSGYVTAKGTSITTPHAAGAAALLMQAGRQYGMRSDWMSVKRVLETGARKIPNVAVFEQGHGVVSLEASLEHLRQMDSLPALAAQSKEGSTGLLARSYRPGTAEFTLTNLDSALTRIGVLSSEPWVQSSFKTLTLPSNVPRLLPLRLNPPTTPGVHSAFLTIFNQGKFGHNIEIPVTYVKPLELSAQDNSYSTSDRLEVGRFKRYFFEVKPGSGSLKVSARMLTGVANATQGTAQVHVFRPDGQSAHQSPEIGANGKGLTTLFQTEAPVPGVWEVVVVAVPDQQGTFLHAEYSLDAAVAPGAVGTAPIQLAQAAGSTVTHEIQVVNPFRSFTGRVEGVGITKSDASQPWRVIQHRSPVDEFTVTEQMARMRVEISNPVTPYLGMDYDLDLYLDRYDPTSPRGFVTIQQKRTASSNQEFIEVKDLPPGRYLVYVMANGRLPESLQYQYRRMVGAEGFNVMVEDPVRKRELRDTWTAKVTIRAPQSPGKYTGYLFLRDTEKDETLTWIPFEVSVGLPGLSVQAYDSQLVSGRTGTVVLETRDLQTGHLVDATLTVNGQRFVGRNGRVSLPVHPAGASHTLRVEVNAPGFQFFTKEITLPVSDTSSPHPVGVSPTQENSIWRRKIMSQWP